VVVRTAKNWDRIALLALLLGTAVRVWWTLIEHPPLDHVYSDMQGYVERAERVASRTDLNRGDAYNPPGTHLLLSLPMRLFGVDRPGLWVAAVLWATLSIAIPWLSWRLIRHWLGLKIAAIAAVLTAAWPLFISYGAFFLSETPSIAFLLAVLLVLDRARRGTATTMDLVVGGLLAGWTLVIRPHLALNVAVALVPLVLLWHTSRRQVLLVIAAVSIPVAGVVVLNSRLSDRLTLVSENAGLNFFIAHCRVRVVNASGDGYFSTFLSPVAAQLGRGRDYTFTDHPPFDQGFFLREGFRCVRRDGLAHLRLIAGSINDMGATTVPWPASNEPRQRRFVVPANFAYSILIVPTAIWAIIYVRRRWTDWQGVRRCLIHLACALPTPLLFAGEPRFRVPYDVFGLALLAAALVFLGRVASRSRSADDRDGLSPN
jgi:4-amino-4-deoxy-L-arabinose transferase-like glycosyltransferase